MKRLIDRRTVLLSAGSAVVAAAGPVAAQADIGGTVTFQGGAAIPEGELEVYLEDLAVEDASRRRLARTRSASSGRSKAMTFSLPRPARRTAAGLEIVARLERRDGWLLARGSAPFEPGSPVHVTLDPVLY